MFWVMIDDNSLLFDGLIPGGAPVMWKRILTDLLPGMRSSTPRGSNVLELGYGDGVLSCFLARNLGWTITGIDVNSKAEISAKENAVKYNVQDRVRFCSCSPIKVLEHKGAYDAVFAKTVLYGAKTVQEYAERLDWISSVIRPGGVFINFETGLSNSFVQMYRRLRRREYSNLCLYTKEIEGLYDSRFQILHRDYYGGGSQFFAPIPKLYYIAYKLEEVFQERNADNCFAVAMILRKPVIKKFICD